MTDRDFYSIVEVKEQWYVGRSKRFPGQKYFFNPATGESVWHREEITNKGRCYDVTHSHEYFPEPLYSPNHNDNTNVLSNVVPQDYKNVWEVASIFDQPNENLTASLSNFNKNAQSSDSLSVTSITSNNYKPKILSNKPVNVEMLNKYLHQTKQQPSNNILTQVNSRTVLYNQSINTRQIFDRLRTNNNSDSNPQSSTNNNLTCIQTLPTSDENTFHNNVHANLKNEQKTPSIILLSERFKTTMRDDNNNNKKVMTPVLKRRIENTQEGPAQKKALLNCNDLRLKLRARRKSQEPFQVKVSDNHDEHEDITVQEDSHFENDVKSTNIIHNNNKIDDIQPYLSDNSCTSEENDKSAFPLNASLLKRLATAAARTDRWYIVVDTNILLGNLTFVDKLVKSDPTCRMMVPYQVHRELEYKIKSQKRRLASMAACAARYLARELKSKTVVIGQTALKAQDYRITCKNGDDEIINCCLQVIEENFHVILLTNDIVLCSKAESSDIVSFTSKEVKDYIINKSKNNLPPEQCKIIVPNNNNNIWSFESHIAEFLPNSTSEIGNNIPSNNQNTASNGIVSQKCIRNTNIQPVHNRTEVNFNMRSVPGKILSEKNTRNKLFQEMRSSINKQIEQPEINTENNVPVYKIRRNTAIEFPKYISKNKNADVLSRIIETSLPISIRRIPTNVNESKKTIQNKKLDSQKDDKHFDNESIITEGSLQIVFPNDMFDLENENHYRFIVQKNKKLVSSFTKVMEEGLTHVLRLYPVKGEMLPAPWNFREAVFNIKSIFDLHPYIGPASKALNERILTLTNLLGVMRENIHPEQYMLMFNEATELVKTLKVEHPNNKNILDTEMKLLRIIKSVRNCDEGSLNLLFSNKCNKPIIIRESESRFNESEQITSKNTKSEIKNGGKAVAGQIPKSALNKYIDDNNINNIVEFIKTFFDNIKNTFAHMRDFCVNYKANLNDNLSENKKFNIKRKACDQYQTANAILNLLERILQRGVGLEEVHGILSDKKNYVSTQYRSTISEYIKQVKVLLDDMNTIRNKVI